MAQLFWEKWARVDGKDRQQLHERGKGHGWGKALAELPTELVQINEIGREGRVVMWVIPRPAAHSACIVAPHPQQSFQVVPHYLARGGWARVDMGKVVGIRQGWVLRHAKAVAIMPTPKRLDQTSARFIWLERRENGYWCVHLTPLTLSLYLLPLIQHGCNAVRLFRPHFCQYILHVLQAETASKHCAILFYYPSAAADVPFLPNLLTSSRHGTGQVALPRWQTLPIEFEQHLQSSLLDVEGGESGKEIVPNKEGEEHVVVDDALQIVLKWQLCLHFVKLKLDILAQQRDVQYFEALYHIV
mmetsp:Transcript_11324/g.29920  ORF Transcript_11324/g.29920 Transcript_11324/m.29920 type:complete len:301 (-) Transcript_11324:805-1707(-)